ncbi:winged helix domain-containing protein [Fuscibacter oryzae]|uniref:Winged helix domain-containing protein n=1 Tax=Fuscibacter oryzae TaxID=2803939 RepID=A0A8J7MTV9_9RHOB|nr:hypothetical protein [Fuscibacter oryzae]MBL4928915.1 hypothetical protein [Fuscibacter oryzae]
MGKPQTWDRVIWTQISTDGTIGKFTTTAGETWALRALIAAGNEGLRPTDGAEGRFALLVEKLRALGVQIDSTSQAAGANVRTGFRLMGTVERFR